MSKPYDPFTRGPYPVGVRTLTLSDGARDRALPVEVWYPATDGDAGRDRDAGTWDTFELLGATVYQEAVRNAAPAELQDAPLVVFSHGLAGHRRQSTFFTTHLASHGYVVIAPDHVGNTLPDVMLLAATAPQTLLAEVEQSSRDRMRDIPFLIDAFRGADDAIPQMVDFDRIGMTGHSFGGWTTVVTTSTDLPVRCALPLAPVGTGQGAQLFGGDPYEGVALDYAERVPTLILAANRDSLCTLPTVDSLHAALGNGHTMLVLHDADHFHFCDRALEVHSWFGAMGAAGGVTGSMAYALAPLEELIGEAPGHNFVRGPGLAHFDAHLRKSSAARELLQTAITEQLAERGATVSARNAAAAPHG